MNRRNIVLAGAAAAAAAAGATLAWRQSRPTAPGGAPAVGAAMDDATQALWAMSFDTPDGKTLAMSSFKGQPLLLNFWATWCPPCVEELPLLDAFYQQNKAKDGQKPGEKSWQVLGLAVDQPSAVRKWLQARPLSFAVGMAGLNGTDLSRAMGNLGGGLPFSVVLGASGGVLHRKVGKVTAQELAQWAGLT